MLIGLLIGIGMILPGISGGVLAVIFGVYEKIIKSLGNFSKDAKGSIKFLLPIFCGILIGIIVGAKLLKIVFEKYYVEACYTFIGLILGSIPFLINEAKNSKNGEQTMDYFALIIACLFSLFISVVSKNQINISSHINHTIASWFKLFLTGFIFVSGKIIPGISSSFMLIMIGMYDYFLEIISNPLIIFTGKFWEILPILIGIIVGALFFIKLINYLLEKHYNTMYSTIIGLILGSLNAIYPEKVTVLGVFFIILGFAISYIISTKSNKYN